MLSKLESLEDRLKPSALGKKSVDVDSVSFINTSRQSMFINTIKEKDFLN